MPALELILQKGCLARRILRALGGRYSPANIRSVYGTLAQCLEANELFQ
jgi:hypothetical protein